MQAILVTYHGPTNRRGSRLKATADRGSITIPYPHGASHHDRDRIAAEALVEKFLAEDEKQGQPREGNPWGRPLVSGGLPGNKGSVFVFAGEDPRQVLVQCRDERDAEAIRRGVQPKAQLSGVHLGCLRDAIAAARI